MRLMMSRFALMLVALCAPVVASAQWEKVPGFDGRFFDEVFFVDATHGWAAESFSPNIVYTTNGGASWNTGVIPGSTGSKMRDLCFVNRSVGFATGTDGLFRTTDGGRTWSDITPITLGTIPAVWFRNVNEGVIAAGACDGSDVLFMHTVDGGATWTPTAYTVDLDASVGGIRYDGGRWYAAGGRGKVWISDDAENWTLFNSGSDGWQEDLDVVDGTIYTASTTAGSCEEDGGGYLLVLPAGSVTWTKTDPVQTYPFWGVSALSATEAWAAGDQGHIYHTTNAGERWDRASCGLRPTDHVDDIDFVDANNGWAVGDGIFRYTGRIDVLPVTVTPSLTVCAGSTVQLQAAGGAAYRWEPAIGLSDPTIANPTLVATTTTTYTVYVMSDMGCTGTASVTVTVGPGGAQAIELPQVTADVRDDDVEIPIRLLGPVTQSACAPDSVTLTVGFNGTLFFPRSVSRGRITDNRLDGGERRVTIELDRAALAGAGDLLTTITGNAMLGNALETPITVVAMTWNGTPTAPSAAPGRLSLTGICMTGDGPRLLDAQISGIYRIAPNPATGPATVDVRAAERGTHVLEVYSLAGDLVFEARWESAGGDATRQIVLPAELPSGAYQVVLRSPSHRDTETLFITM